MKQFAFDLSTGPDPTLENFIVGRNAELVQQLHRLAFAPGDERFFYLWGAPGSGRSHLAHGVLAALKRGGSRVTYVACEAQVRFPDRLHSMDAVAIDDVERLGEEGQLDLFKLYNALRESNGILLAIGDVAPMQLRLRPDVVTRLGWGLVYEVRGLSDAEKTAALSEYAAARGFALQPEVAGYLLSHVQRDMPALVSMVDALDRYSMEAKRAVTVSLLREMLDSRNE